MVIPLAAVKRSRFALLLAVISLHAIRVAAQGTRPAKAQTARIKPSPVRFEEIARQAGLNALNVYGGDTHKEVIIETTGNAAIIFDYANVWWPDILFPK